LRLRQGWTKGVLRRAMNGIVPSEVIWCRDKVGFETPEQDWLRQWINLGLCIFEDQAKSGLYLDLQSVREKLVKWSQNKPDLPLWRWINLEIWLRVWKAV